MAFFFSMALKNVAYRVISQLLYPFIFAVITVCFIFIDIPRTVKIPISDEIPIFNEDKDPVIITHLTDLHISTFYPDAIPHCNLSLNFISKYIKPTFNVITGDCTDNFIKLGWPRKSGQIEEQFKMYNQLLRESGVYNYTVEAIGNHDSWAMSKLTNESFVIKYFAHNKFTPSSFVERDGVRIVTLNPYRIPTPLNPIGNNPKLEESYLLALEENLKHSSNDTLMIVITHFPSPTLFPQDNTPKTDLSYAQLLSQNHVQVVLNGHIHKSVVLYHEDANTVEIVGTPSKFFPVFGLLSVDNKQINYVRINSENPTYASISYPGSSLYSASSLLSYNGFVRVVSFNDEAQHFSAELTQSGKDPLKCNLVKVRNISETGTLYQCQFQSSEQYSGLYKLHVTGDMNFDNEIEFYVNQSYEVKQKTYLLYNSKGFIIGVGLGLCYHFLVFCGMILPFTRECFGEYDENIIYCILFGPLITGYRLKKLEIWAKLIYGVLIIWPTFAPIGFFYTGEERAVISAWGFSIRGDFQWENTLIAILIVFLFLTGVAIQELFLIVSTSWRVSYYGDASLAGFLLLVSFGIWVWFSAELTNISPLIAASLPFVIFPIIAIVSAVIHRPLRKLRKLREAERERQRQLNDELLNAEKGELEGEGEEIPTPIP